MSEFGALVPFWGTRAMEIVRRNNSPALLWKKIRLTTTRKANANTRLRRAWQNEVVLRACAELPPPSGTLSTISLTSSVEGDGHQLHANQNEMVPDYLNSH